VTRTLVVLLLLLAPSHALAQPSPVRQYVREHEAAILREFLALVSIPNVRSDVPNIKRNAELLRQMLDKRAMKAEVWDTPSTPVVFGERTAPGATRTILFYIHYDGQAVERDHWMQPDPFVPVLRSGSLDAGAPVVTDVATRTDFPDSWRVYGRSAGDDKGPIQAFVSALDALGTTPTHNIKVVLHGEEEGGGPALDTVIKAHADRLRSDVLIILDGPQHASGKPTIYYGARGGASLDVTVYTAKSAMHSGNYGNWMPDANVRLSQLVASMVEPSGRVAIAGFYDDVPGFSEADEALMRAVPDNTAAMRQAYGVGSVDGAARSLQEGLNLPAFSVHTMKGGEVGGVIAATASAEIALRLVKENSPTAMVNRVVEHIRKQGYFIVDTEPDAATLASHSRIAKVVTRAGRASGAWRTEPTSPDVMFVADALRRQSGADPVRIRTLGGGVPAGPFIEGFKVPTVGVSLANYDDNQHSDNENLRLGNLWDGIESLAAIMAR
jgi:acetylornithine deacetylase/succinyl-diaminopimelate desuccinylase-like protein